jgi:hypothetical protein
LVILGLLTGGILAGQSLIRASELRNLTSQASQLNTALLSFRDKYFYLPGDMPNAVRFWTAQTGNINDGYVASCTALTTPATGLATCNGNGNGQIATAGNIAGGYEAFRAWQHLANAGLLEGSYSGVSASTTVRNSDIGSNIPATRLSSVGIFLRYIGPVSANANTYDGDYNHTLQFGQEEAASGLTVVPFLKPFETWNMDTKLDDGRPGQGKFRTYKPAHTPDCALDADNYSLATNDKTCWFNIILGF